MSGEVVFTTCKARETRRAILGNDGIPLRVNGSVTTDPSAEVARTPSPALSAARDEHASGTRVGDCDS